MEPFQIMKIPFDKLEDKYDRILRIAGAPFNQIHVCKVFDDLKELEDEADFNTVRSDHSDYEIEQVSYDSFVNKFSLKPEWTIHIQDQESALNTVVNLEGHFLIVEEIEDQRIGSKKIS